MLCPSIHRVFYKNSTAPRIYTNKNGENSPFLILSILFASLSLVYGKSVASDENTLTIVESEPNTPISITK